MENMELKIEHLCGYLPYGLKYLYHNEIKDCKSIDVAVKYVDFGWGDAAEIKDVKPILIPIISLSLSEQLEYVALCLNHPSMEDEITLEEVMIDQMRKEHGDFVIAYSCRCDEGFLKIRRNGDTFISDEDFSDSPVFNMYEKFQWLFSKHVDVFGLIEQGLAIDASTLETNPYQ